MSGRYGRFYDVTRALSRHFGAPRRARRSTARANWRRDWYQPGQGRSVKFALIAFGVVTVGFALFLSRDARRVWRGERLRYLPLYARFFDVTHRSFAVMVAVIASFGAVGLVAGTAGVLWDEPPSFAGGVVLGLIVLMLGGMVLGGVLEATNRPRFLIPPPHRSKPGSSARKPRRRA